jgi:hypothetical protein
VNNEAEIRRKRYNKLSVRIERRNAVVFASIEQYRRNNKMFK